MLIKIHKERPSLPFLRHDFKDPQKTSLTFLGHENHKERPSLPFLRHDWLKRTASLPFLRHDYKDTVRNAFFTILVP
jgi:hypothetical protein